MVRWQKIALLIVIVAALIIVGRTVILQRLSSPAGDSVVVEETEFVTVSRGTIMTTVNASGNIVYPEQVELGFSVAGNLRQIVVTLGDTVEEGAPLAYIDDIELQDAVRREESNLRSAELNLEKLVSGARPEDVRTAELAVTEAEANLESVQEGPSQTDITQAEASVVSAQVVYDEAVKTLANLLHPDKNTFQAAQNRVSSAEDTLAQAQAALDALRSGGSEAKIQSAANALQLAENRYQGERDRILESIDSLLEDIEEAEERLEEENESLEEAKENDEEFSNSATQRVLDDAQEKVDEAQEHYDELLERKEKDIPEWNKELYPNPPPGSEAGELLSAAREAQLALENARLSVSDDEQGAQRNVESAAQALALARGEFEALLNPTSEDVMIAEKRVESAQLSLDNAQRNLAELQQGPKSEDLERARNDVERARLNLQKTLTGATSQDVKLQRLQVERAQLSLDTARRNLSQAVLRAPFAGLVAAVEGTVGQRPGNKVVTLVRADRIEMQARVDEADVGAVQKGQRVVVTTYASPDDKISGTVAAISPVSENQQGVVLFPINIQLEPGDQRLRGGLSANAMIEVSSRENVLLVANRAIRREGEERVVYVRLDGDELERRVVEIGVRDSEVSEIVSGVSEGEVVAIQSRTGGSIGGGGIDIRTR